MALLSIYDTTTGEILSLVGCKDGDEHRFILKPNEAYIVGHFNPNEYVVQDGTAISASTVDFSAVYADKLMEIQQAYADTFLSSVDCTLADGTTVITMNAGQPHAQTLKNGYDLAVLNDETAMSIVDFYNVVHANLSMTDIVEIVKQQGNDARAQWEKRVMLRAQLDAATTIEEIGVISW